ncbi:Ribonuclease III domain [Plasmopara halstedii]|uniref:Ribonuclease III domain n=1 Tax=Plasmopara halstedii TaxID=4781 RepID=A0A0P1B174_PLAHL|nr:Ribonuclease III domain [Plasmopara halstedii]CEG48481.1 Ribonuclease III domain [Plasmopara halstedii]|eukprot:XP_024584850.1 Ribonuclease III domain [Plasmopara halstedii]
MTKKRRYGHSRSRRSSSEYSAQFKVTKRQKNLHSLNISRISEASSIAISDFQALQNCSSSAALVDVFEWLGDAVVGELVGRCLLSQFHIAPLSARVFRNLRLAIVTNYNLAQVYDVMGYAAVQRHDTSRKDAKMKQRADVVEAVVGELVFKLHQCKENSDIYQAHLDMLVAMMLQCHFAELKAAAKEKGETELSAKGPLSLAFNSFACLPDERLDESTGELIVTDGLELLENVQDERSCVRVYTLSKVDTQEPYHYFTAIKNVSTIRVESVRLAMVQLDDQHILRTSQEIFEVFKVYGMAVLSERISWLLALPHVSLQSRKCSIFMTPADLTRQRQRILSITNLAVSAIALGIAEVALHDNLGINCAEEAVRRLQEESRLANTLRAFVGFYSAVVTVSMAVIKQSNVLITTICNALYSAANSSQEQLIVVQIPERESLIAMRRSINEARMFMNSQACDDLHALGEREVSQAALERCEFQPSLNIRQCISNMFQSSFDALNEGRQTQQKQSDNLSDRFQQIVVLFAQHKTEACRTQMTVFEHDLAPCVEQLQFRKWEVSSSTLTLAMRDSFFRMLLHDICHFHAINSSSRNTRDGTRITQLRLPLHYTWSNIDTRITTEQLARS